MEIVRSEKIIAIPIKIPFITSFLNKFLGCQFKLVLHFKYYNFKENQNNLNNNTKFHYSAMKNEEKNIPLFKNQLTDQNENYEFLFGDDNSSDHTKAEITKIKNEFKSKQIKLYEGPGICKAENVYKGVELANGEVIVIYDADLTVSFDDINFAINILNNSNADFINCTRMIYPQKDGAMKKFNFLGNSFFAFYSVFYSKKNYRFLCGTKIFYKKIGIKLKDISCWGAKDLWGDFDLLISAYKNNLKILEVPVTYFERIEGKTKMTNVFANALRMFWIIIYSFYKLRLKD